MAEKLLVLVVDRDDDIGTKTGIKGPIIGEEANLDVATKLALEDPEESDANTIFAAVKIARELRRQGKSVEVATVTGHRNLGFLADSSINNQLKVVFQNFPADGVVFVTDGAEDDQVVPLILSYAPIVSKRTVVVKQVVQLERTYYIIKNALRDKDIAPILFGVPGIAFLLWALLGNLAVKLILGLIGLYFVAIATGLDTVVGEWITAIIRGISFRGPGAPFYLISLAMLIMAAYSGYRNYMAIPGEAGIYEMVRSIVGFSALSAILYLFGRSVDTHRQKKAFLIGKYIRHMAIVMIVWVIVDATMKILEGQAAMTDLYIVSLTSILFYVVVAQIAAMFEESIKHSRKLIGVEAYSHGGARIGRVKDVDPEKGIIVISSGKKDIRVTADKISVNGHGVIVGV
ncbi:MAG: putative rane protein [Candidatus Diapherotrites archaeon]|nr:putative rane protein [Candidatus Diapherotrites archaeon]MDN5367046.1 putative rane protein [Candidatus Diapherotrites archaeon]